MRFIETKLRGAYFIEPDPVGDERGLFARTFCRREFEEHGLDPTATQCSVSYNEKRGTLRGMHYQLAPHEETKLVRVTRGAAYDVVVDLRPDSPTCCGWVGCELTAQNRRMVYVPKGCAHGFVTLADCTELCYQISVFYEPASARGVRWDDPAFGIDWPLVPGVISERDRSYQDYSGVNDRQGVE